MVPLPLTLSIIKDETLIRKRASGGKIIVKSENMLTVWETKHPTYAGRISLGRKEDKGTLGFLQYGEFENYALNFNAYKGKERPGKKNNEKQR